MILACCALAARAQSPALIATDDLLPLTSEAMVKAIPIMLVFTLSDCQYCARAKTEFLEPLAADPAYEGKVLIREIDLTSEAPLRDFDGKTVERRDFGRRFGIRSVPAVLTFTSAGRQVTEPLIGLHPPDFYRLYLAQQIEAAQLVVRRAGAPR